MAAKLLLRTVRKQDSKGRFCIPFIKGVTDAIMSESYEVSVYEDKIVLVPLKSLKTPSKEKENN